MHSFKLTKINKNSWYFPLIIVVIFFLLSYFFRNQYTPIIFVVIFFSFTIISGMLTKKVILEVQNNNIMIRTKSSEVIFMTSIKPDQIKKALWKDEGKGIGPAVILKMPDGTDISIGTMNISFNWAQPVEEIIKPNYSLEDKQWNDFIQAIGLHSEVLNSDEILANIEKTKKVVTRISMGIIIFTVALVLISVGLLLWLDIS